MKKITLQNGMHTADHVPVMVRLPGVDPDADTVLRETVTGREVPHQLGPCRCADSGGAAALSFIIDNMAPAEVREYELLSGGDPQPARVDFEDVGGDHLDVTVDGAPFTSYRYGPHHVRPYFHPVLNPFGHSLTRHYPMEEAQDHELTDHVHHKGFYVAHGDVGGSDNWSEEKTHGFVRTRRLEYRGGPVVGEVIAHNDWVHHDERKACEEVRIYRIWATPAGGRLIDLWVRFIASEGDLRMGDTKEGGICALRLTYHSKLGSVIVSSTGATTAEGTPDETWGKRYHWLDHSGPVHGQVCGATIMDTPGNFRYPTYWHVRTNGMMTANPFGLSYYFDDKSVDGSHVVPAGEALEFRYRVYFHVGDVRSARVAEKYNNYIFGPRAIAVE